MSGGTDEPTLIPPSADWSPEQALDYARQRKLAMVVISGLDEEGCLVCYSSRMSRAEALYLHQQASLHTLRR